MASSSMWRSVSHTRAPVSLQWELAKASHELGYILTPRGKVPYILRPVWIHKPSSKTLYPGQAVLRAALSPPPNTHNMGRELASIALSTRSPGQEKLQKLGLFRWAGGCMGRDLRVPLWILVPNTPEVFFTLKIQPYSFWSQEYNLLLWFSKQQNGVVVHSTAGLLMSRCFQYVHYSVVTDSYIW